MWKHSSLAAMLQCQQLGFVFHRPQKLSDVLSGGMRDPGVALLVCCGMILNLIRNARVSSIFLLIKAALKNVFFQGELLHCTKKANQNFAAYPCCTASQN